MIDHVGVGVADLAQAAAVYERLGFTLTPYARHEGATSPGGATQALATANRCAMFGHGYLELIAVVDASLPDNGLGERIRRHPGIQITAFTTGDVEGTVTQLRAAGFDAKGPLYLERPAAIEGGTALARFDRVTVPDHQMPDVRAFYIKHLTPEVLWQPRHLEHRNGTIGVAGVTFAVDGADATLSRLCRFAGVADREGVLARDGSTLTVLRRQQAAERFRGLLAADAPEAVAITLTVRSLTKLRQHLDAAAVPHLHGGDEVLVGPRHACGATLAFVEHAAG